MLLNFAKLSEFFYLEIFVLTKIFLQNIILQKYFYKILFCNNIGVLAFFKTKNDEI